MNKPNYTYTLYKNHFIFPPTQGFNEKWAVSWASQANYDDPASTQSFADTSDEAIRYAKSQIDKEVANQVAKLDTWGKYENKYWATTRKQALLRLSEFIKYNFKDFGAYEDAMPVNSW